MPPSEKISREKILETALDLIRISGFENLNARNVAKKLNCSTQPIFSQFGSMDGLKQDLFQYACNVCVSQVIEHADKTDFLPRTTKWYINLVRKESNLFRFLYFSNGFSGSLLDLLLSHESNVKMIAQLMSQYGLSEKKCRDIVLRSFLFLHGIGSLIASNQMQIENEEIFELVRRTVKDMVTAAKSGDD